MEEKNRVFAEAKGNFSFDFFIEKAEVLPDEPEDSFSVTGIASTTNIDHDAERMAEPALERMVNIINEKSVPLRVEHQKNENAVIGKINRAWLDERRNLWIKADLDRENPAAIMLHNALKAGAKLGLSVGGRVVRATRELAEGIGRTVKTFYDVKLDEVSVTPRPSNFDAWLLNKHYIEKEDETNKYYNTQLHQTFLFENPKFDYLSAIEKSIPSQAWKKVEPELKNKDMNNDTKNTEEVKFASMEYVDKKFSELSELIKSSFKKLTVEPDKTEAEKAGETASDQHLPEDAKTENPAQVRTVKDDANGTQEATPVADAETKPLESSNPPGELTENPAQVKSATKGFVDKMKKAVVTVAPTPSKTETTDTKEKEVSSDSSTTKPEEPVKATDAPKPQVEEETGTTKGDEESSGSSSSKPDTSDYELPELKRASKAASIDLFTAYVAKQIDDFEERLAKNGKRVPGLRSVIIDSIRNDETMQKSIREMLNEPGPKKSYSFGNAYAVLKDGSRLRLVPEEGMVKKSIDPKAKFGDVYKAHFSSAEDAKK